MKRYCTKCQAEEFSAPGEGVCFATEKGDHDFQVRRGPLKSDVTPWPKHRRDSEY